MTKKARIAQFEKEVAELKQQWQELRITIVELATGTDVKGRKRDMAESTVSKDQVIQSGQLLIVVKDGVVTIEAKR